MYLTNAVRGTPLWYSALALVRRRYATTFGASTSPEPESFVVAVEPGPDGTADGQALACIGITGATTSALFCERYLPARAEEVLELHTGTPCRREEIVEVGPLAAEAPGAGSEVMTILPLFAWERGMRYGMMTVTRQVAAMAVRQGYPLEFIVDARRDQLSPEERAGWGSYYDMAPRLCLVRLENLAPLLVRSAGRYRSANLSFLRDDRGRSLAHA
jgi:hypothetical protein